jgi:hypothetical protein
VANNLMEIQLKKKFVLERLLEKGVKYTQQGRDVRDCDYEELCYELVLESFREIDISSESNRWF